MNRNELQKKLSVITSDLLREKGHIAFVDIFLRLGYLDAKDYESWRMKHIPFLEKAIKVNLSKISFIMKTVRRNCQNGNLAESWTSYKSWGKGKKVCLQFSRNGEDNIEKTYATHFIKPQQLNKKQKEAEQIA